MVVDYRSIVQTRSILSIDRSWVAPQRYESMDPGWCHCIWLDTVDGINPALVDRWFTPLFIGLLPSQVVQDFATIHSITVLSSLGHVEPKRCLHVQILELIMVRSDEVSSGCT